MLLFRCIAALLGAQCILTDLPDRLKLLRKNIESNLEHGDLKGSAKVDELVWGDDPDPSLIEPFPDYGMDSYHMPFVFLADYAPGQIFSSWFC